jgi:Rad3-related DNA helicase
MAVNQDGGNCIALTLGLHWDGGDFEDQSDRLHLLDSSLAALAPWLIRLADGDEETPGLSTPTSESLREQLETSTYVTLTPGGISETIAFVVSVIDLAKDAELIAAAVPEVMRRAGRVLRRKQRVDGDFTGDGRVVAAQVAERLEGTVTSVESFDEATLLPDGTLIIKGGQRLRQTRLVRRDLERSISDRDDLQL